MILRSGGEAAGPLRRGHVLSTCPYCACGCGLYFLTDSSRLAGVSPSRGHPISEGRLCARGWGAHEADLWGDRLLRPSVRGPSGLRQVQWSEALALAAEELQALLVSGKRVGVLVSGRCTNEEAYLGVKLARGALGSGNVDSPLRSPYAAILQGLADSGEPIDLVESLASVEESRRILILEGDVASTHPEVAFSVLRAIRRGASVVTLGLARTQMSQVASSHVFLDPGSPRFLHPGPLEVLGEAHATPGEVSVILSPWTPDPVALSASVRALAECLGRIGRERGEAIRFLPLPIRANTRGAYEMGAAPERLPGAEPLDAESAGERLRGLWGRDPAQEPGLGAREMVGSVEGLVVLRDGSSASPPSPLSGLRTQPALESLVVLDAFRSVASDAATVVLPLAGLSETDGTFTSALGRVQRLRAAAGLPGECRQGWEALSDLLGHLGSPVAYASARDVFCEIRAAVPAYAAVTDESLEKEWGKVLPGVRPGTGRPPEETGAETGDTEGFGTHWLAVEGAFEWKEDAMVLASPTLRRDGAARRKLYPRGLVVMSRSDGQSLGIREGWALRLRSRGGEALVPVSLSSRVEDGVILVPVGLRQELAQVMGDAGMERVEVERA